MVTIGITGSLASGKSFVLNYLASLGYATFSADLYIRDLYNKEDMQLKILALIPELKEFDKMRLAQIIYDKADIRQTLQNFIHPFVVNGLLEFKNTYNSNLLLFAEIPLLFESSFEQYFDLVVATFCSEASRLERAIMRSNFDQKIYDQIATIQWSQMDKIEKADFTINTDSNLIMFESQIAQLIKECHKYARNNTGY